jgi:hypothetical protein
LCCIRRRRLRLARYVVLAPESIAFAARSWPTNDSAHADYPTTTKFLNEREKALAVARLVTDEDEKERLTHKQAFVAAVKDPKTWVSLTSWLTG